MAQWDKVKRWVGGAAALLAGGTLLALLAVDLSDPPDVLLFFGRFHPIMVHLPIGFLLLAALLEGAYRLDRRFKLLRHATTFALALGAGAAVLAALVGYLLSLGGGYNEELVAWHMWLGIGVAAGAVAASILKVAARRRGHPALDKAYLAVLVATVGMLSAAGHFGGALTHGPGYLTRYMPAPMQYVIGASSVGAEARRDVPIDSAVVYQELVHPIFEQRCVSCHGAGKTKGGLRMDTKEHLLKGGDDGEVIAAGKPGESEILRRITLPLYHDDRMPPDGEEPLLVEETELIRWWIKSGASFEATVAELRGEETPTSVQTVLARRSRPKEEVKTGIYALEVPPPDSQAVKKLDGRAGIDIQPIAQDAPFLQVRLSGDGQVGRGRIEELKPIYPQVAWLDLAGADVTASALEAASEMKHLTRLHLENTPVADAALAPLARLEHLRYLNLYGTAVTDEGLGALAGLKNLRALYLWQTPVTDSGAQRLKKQLPGLQINRGSTLAPDSVKTDSLASGIAKSGS